MLSYNRFHSCTYYCFLIKCVAADVLLWRNKKISGSLLMGATAVWVLFEWLNYHFLTLLFVAMVLGMLVQFLWLNVAGLFNRYKHLSPLAAYLSQLNVNCCDDGF